MFDIAEQVTGSQVKDDASKVISQTDEERGMLGKSGLLK